MLAAMADDMEWHEAEGMPYGGVYRGGPAVMENVRGDKLVRFRQFADTAKFLDVVPTEVATTA